MSTYSVDPQADSRDHDLPWRDQDNGYEYQPQIPTTNTHHLLESDENSSTGTNVRDIFTKMGAWQCDPNLAITVTSASRQDVIKAVISKVHRAFREAIPKAEAISVVAENRTSPVLQALRNESRSSHVLRGDVSNTAPSSQSVQSLLAGQHLFPRDDTRDRSHRVPGPVPSNQSGQQGSRQQQIGEGSAFRGLAEGDLTSEGRTPASHRTDPAVAIDHNRFHCVYHHPGHGNLNETDYCSKMHRHVSLLKRHHESQVHDFHYCATCFCRFETAAEREEHELTSCHHRRCVTRGCPNYGAFPEGVCHHGHRNSQQDQWEYLYRMAHGHDIGESIILEPGHDLAASEGREDISATFRPAPRTSVWADQLHDDSAASQPHGREAASARELFESEQARVNMDGTFLAVQQWFRQLERLDSSGRIDERCHAQYFREQMRCMVLQLQSQSSWMESLVETRRQEQHDLLPNYGNAYQGDMMDI